MAPRRKNYKTKAKDLALAREYTRRLRARLGDNLLTVTLYGSRARGDARDGSDFDFIIRVRENTEDTREIVLDIDVEMMNDYEELFVGMIYDERAWEYAAKFPFGWNVAREGLNI